jgi:hypothetical protein
VPCFLVPLHEYNRCHNPEGPGGGRFCSMSQSLATAHPPHTQRLLDSREVRPVLAAKATRFLLPDGTRFTFDHATHVQAAGGDAALQALGREGVMRGNAVGEGWGGYEVTVPITDAQAGALESDFWSHGGMVDVNSPTGLRMKAFEPETPASAIAAWVNAQFRKRAA